MNKEINPFMYWGEMKDFPLYDKKAMDEYAKQEAIGFQNWLAESEWGLDSMLRWFSYGKPDEHPTTEQLYTIFKNQKGK